MAFINAAADADLALVPAGWAQMPGSPLVVRSDAGGETGTIVFQGFALFKFFDPETDSLSQTFTLDASTTSVSACLVYEGVDTTDPVPEGAVDPSGPTVTAIDAVGIALPFDNAVGVIAYMTMAGLTAITPATGLVPRVFEQDDVEASMLVADFAQAIAATTADSDGTAALSVTAGSITVGLRPAAEVTAAEVGPDARDAYKSILLRNSLPRSYNKLRTSGFAKLTAIIGESDNNLGGLFGAANFLDPSVVVTPQFFEDVGFLAIEEAQDTSAGSLLVTVPSIVADNDFMYAVIAKHSTTGLGVITPPGAWTLVRTASNSDGAAGGIVVEV